MQRVVLVHAPFCTPASPPYALTSIYSFLRANGIADVHIEDLNLAFYLQEYPDFQKYCKSLLDDYTNEVYAAKAKEFIEGSRELYTSENKRILAGGTPKFYDEAMRRILIHQPEVVAFSIVYSSQVFFVSALIDGLKAEGIKTIIGGPAVNRFLREKADAFLRNEIELLSYLGGAQVEHDDLHFDFPLDFSAFPLEDYFVPSAVLPIRTTSACYYKQCAFCTHHGNVPYFEYALEPILETIRFSGQKHVFFTDDMIPKNRLLEMARLLAPLNITWMCQLRPVKELDRPTLQTLYDAGMRHVIWGVESGCARVLDAMKKGTNPIDAAQVLHDAAHVGITNALYMLFGFPTETKEEFRESIAFLKLHASAIHLVSTSIFGLQHGAPAFVDPEKYGISEVIANSRDMLDAKLTYVPVSGMSQDEAKRMRKRFAGTFAALDKYPKYMNFFREHLLCIAASDKR